MTLRLICLILFALAASAAHAEFEDGRKAYERRDWLNAITVLRPLAEKGDTRAQILLGSMYGEGFGVVQNYVEALSLYSRAAEKNNAEAMVALAAMYISGLGADKNLDMAEHWSEKAAKAGNQAGAFLYASLLMQKNDGDSTLSAYKWFRRAAQSDHYPEMKKAAQETADSLADSALSVEDVAKADGELNEKE